MQKSDVLECSIEKWYSKFRHLTIKSKMIKLEDDAFISYLIGEGESTLRLPLAAEGTTCSETANDDDDNLVDDDGGDWNDDNADDWKEPSFPELESRIKADIKLLGGEVFPKLNWSAPRDATWISCDKTLKCKFVSDVLLVIKSSDFALRDLTQPFLHCEDAAEVDERADQVFLVLRQWRSDIVPNSEFRCFVRDSVLVGICQRHDDAFFPFIASNVAQISQDIQEFYQQNIRSKFTLNSFVMDVFRSSRGQVLLIDFGPWGRVTDSLMFDWSELDNVDSRTSEKTNNEYSSTSTILPIFRFVESDADMRPTRFASSAVPLDFHHLSTGEDPRKLIDFLSLQKLQNEGVDEDDGD